MRINEHFSLKEYNTFGIDVSTRYFVDITSLESLQELLANSRWKDIPKCILGQGSNILFSQDYPGLVIKISLKGIQKIAEDGQHVWITVGAGENWHQFVMFCIDNQLAGIENLSLIPGTVGAAPIQNIGAYGVELRDVFDRLSAIRISDGEVVNFKNEDCQFGYRDSLFKRELKNQLIISSVNLRLNKKAELHLEYGAIKNTLDAMQVSDVNIKTISDAVIKIRQEKLPDPAVLGNTGSFFKNPIVSQQQFDELVAQYPSMPYFPEENGNYKIPAAWMIEQCGWKGYRMGDAGVHEKHALVLVNYGKAKGSEIKKLSEEIQASVKNKFSIELLAEVNIV